ncbi:acyltransferase [Streptococcus dentasini]
MNRTQKRNSSFELLRILSIVMIIFHHFAIHGDFTMVGETESCLVRSWYYFIIMGGKVGVNIFILISAYFLSASQKKLNLSKLVKFWGRVIFYSLALLALGAIFGSDQVDIKFVIKSFLPITFSMWWFATSYFILYLLHPFINKGLQQLSKTNYQQLLAVLITIFSLVPTFSGTTPDYTELTWFCTLYCIGGYIRKFGLLESFSKKILTAFVTLIVLLNLVGTVILSYLTDKFEIIKGHVIYFYGENKLPIVLISILLFLIFKKIQLSHSKVINTIASTSFAVYLIHDHPIVRPFLWEELFHVNQYQDSWLIIPASIVIVLLVYSACTAIDLIRKRIIRSKVPLK